MAIAGASIIALILALRNEAHRMIDRLDEEDVKVFARFAVIAGAVLPFLPDPIAPVPALGFPLFVAAAARWAEGRFGQEGISALVLIMGSLDVDAAVVTVGGLRAEAISPALAALAIGGTVLVNMAVKLAIVIAYAESKARTRLSRSAPAWSPLALRSASASCGCNNRAAIDRPRAVMAHPT